MKMKSYSTTFFVLVVYTFSIVKAQQMTPEQVVQKSMESYNDRDIYSCLMKTRKF